MRIAFLCSLLVAAPAEAQLPQTLDSIARASLASGIAPGIAVAVIKGGDTLLLRGYGLADVQRRVPMLASTRFRIGSVTKEFTAAAVMQLVEQGKLALDDPLSKLLPDYSGPGERATLRQLLSHTSGIPNMTSMRGAYDPSTNMSASQVLALFEKRPLDFEPGAGWSYNNSGYYLLGLIIERAGGLTYARYVEKSFAQRLHLDATSYCTEPTANTNERPTQAEGYEREADAVERAAPISMSIPFAAGALCSNVMDLARWQRELFAGHVVSMVSLRAMTTPVVLSNGKSQSYGLGLELTELAGQPRIGHGGSIAGFDSYVAHYPRADLTVAVLANSGSANVEALEKKLAIAALGMQRVAVARVPLDDAARKRYLGTYQAGGGRLRILLKGDAVRVEGPVDAELAFVGNDTFVLAEEPDVKIVFTVRDGMATQLEWHARGRTLVAPRLPE